MKQVISYLWPIVLCLGIGFLGGFVTESSVHTWYAQLNKPSFTPPNWMFPVVWTLLYILMGISLGIILNKTTKPIPSKACYVVFGIQLFLNAIWSVLFFGLKNPLLGFIDISALWIAVLATILIFKRYSGWAAGLLLPYLAWITYALTLNAWIWLNNPISK